VKRFLLLLALVVASTSVLAHGRGGRVTLGLHFGVPIYSPYWYYPPPYYYPYPAVIAAPTPPVYVERSQEDSWWYYCESSRGYYPYVKECPGGWQRVPPAPPPAK
jgi:hypothetical protein